MTRKLVFGKDHQDVVCIAIREQFSGRPPDEAFGESPYGEFLRRTLEEVESNPVFYICENRHYYDSIIDLVKKCSWIERSPKVKKDRQAFILLNQFGDQFSENFS